MWGRCRSVGSDQIICLGGAGLSLPNQVRLSHPRLRTTYGACPSSADLRMNLFTCIFLFLPCSHREEIFQTRLGKWRISCRPPTVAPTHTPTPSNSHCRGPLGARVATSTCGAASRPKLFPLGTMRRTMTSVAPVADHDRTRTITALEEPEISP